MKLIVSDGSLPHIPPIRFAVELSDEMGQKFNIDFLREHFRNHILSAYIDLYALESQEEIIKINERIWEMKETLVDVFLGEKKRRA